MGLPTSVLVTHLLCSEILLRAITRRKGWLDESGRVTAFAFFVDPRDPDGLSVNVQSLTDLEGWLSTTFKKSFGADTLHTGRVRDLNLEIGQTEEDLRDGSGHALILGIPSQEDDPKRAQDLATALRDISRRLDRVERKRQP